MLHGWRIDRELFYDSVKQRTEGSKHSTTFRAPFIHPPTPCLVFYLSHNPPFLTAQSILHLQPDHQKWIIHTHTLNWPIRIMQFPWFLSWKTQHNHRQNVLFHAWLIRRCYYMYSADTSSMKRVLKVFKLYLYSLPLLYKLVNEIISDCIDANYQGHHT